MRKSFWVISVASLFAVALLFPAAARADGIDITLDPTSNLTVTAGDTAIAVFTVTNDTGATISSVDFAGGGFGAMSGDPTLVPINALFSLDTCVNVTNGSTCSAEVTYPTNPPAGQPAGDFGVTDSDLIGSANGFTSNNVLYSITVDAAGVPTPEPSSQLLIATGLIVLLALAVRSKRHAPTTPR
jgi:hypothetical protein